MDALGITHPDLREKVIDSGFDGLIDNLKTNDALVKQYHLEALRETLTLQYPSYIFALAMGAGKTVLIGSIYATEFTMAQEYPDARFVQNALVFAPGKTIIESLRELAAMPYLAVLPPRLYKSFAASLKLTFTRDGDPTIPIIPSSLYNVVVTNTEKIRIQKETIRKSDIGSFLRNNQEDEAKKEIANLRLQAIASLPNLAIFSDEAHHTYGQAMEDELKKVRKTVDYLNNPILPGTDEHTNHNSNLICVVNTTGTPYYKRQLLRDVVVWYSLSEGIRDGILKELDGNIFSFDFSGDVSAYLNHIVGDFFKDYRDVTILDDIPAKMAIFFPQTEDVAEYRPVIETKLVELGLSTDLILEHHTSHDEKEEYDRFRNSSKRVALLVSRGVEGWNVPALFSCALARKLQSGGNNFVLQAASRCLRQLPGNRVKARIYLSSENRDILDTQLQESYGEDIDQINHTQSVSHRLTITVKKVQIPPLVTRRLVRSVVRSEKTVGELRLTPLKRDKRKATVDTLKPVIDATTPGVLTPVKDRAVIEYSEDAVDLYSAAVDLASNYHLDPLFLFKELSRIYPGQVAISKTIVQTHRSQVEAQTSQYDIHEETVEEALALIKLDGFLKGIDPSGIETYTAEIQVPVNRLDLLAPYQEWSTKAGSFGFHYDPYNFDSHPEKDFFNQVLDYLNIHPDDVEDIYFTGALTDPQKTDFYVEYKGEDGAWHRYSPDFLIRRKDGKCLIVEIKSANERQHPVDGEQGRKAVAVRQWSDLNTDILKYHMIFVDGAQVAVDQMEKTHRFIARSNGDV
jgi:hypothetical protein